MAETELDEAYGEFWDELLLEAEVSGEPQESVFFRLWAELASENGDCADLTYTPVRRDGQGGYRIDGYAMDTERGELHLAVCDFRSERDVQTANAEAVARSFTRMQRFCELAVQPKFVNSLEETSPAFEAAYPIFTHQSKIRRIRGVLFTNARISMRKKVVAGDAIGRTMTYNLLDFGRYHDIQKSRGRPEPIEIDIAELNGAPLPCLDAHVGGSDYKSYLVVIPGELLAKIYGLYGARLLEQNVRTFLQARTKVNRGIIQTIDSSPEMFFAFNNGLTATAAGVEVSRTADGTPGITAIHDLQIVNGGQTTASILYAQDRNKTDLARVFVQMKLSVVDPGRIEEVVPLISRYANTQNRISEADFFSSHPFHVEMEKISRRLWAPLRPGSIAATKWFYERARGQYRDRQAYGTAAARKKFEAEFPKDQTLQKTDLAKYEMTFACKPHVVSQGAQKCFLAFAEGISKDWETRHLDFNEEYFRHAIAKAILFRWTDRMVGRSDWYQADRGYKANIVPYTLAWLVNHLARERGSAIDLTRVWKLQDVPEELQDVLCDLAPSVAEIVKDPPASVKNISEYAKQQACWARVAGTSLPVSDAIDSATIDLASARDEKKSAAAVKMIDRSIELETMLLRLVGRVDEVEQICRRHRLLSPRSAAALAKLRRGQTSLAQSELNAMSNLIERLWDAGVDLAEIAAAE